MKVRNGDDHDFTPEEAAVDQFTVAALPSIDYAAKALMDAQDRYFRQYPDARKHARALIWDITKTSKTERIVDVRLTADTRGLVDAMNKANGAVTGLTETLRTMGVPESDIGEAIRAVLKFTRKEKPGRFE